MSRSFIFRLWVFLMIGMASVGSRADGPNFRADHVFTGSDLAAWDKLGESDWAAVNGEITAKPRRHEGGWLIMNRSLSNAALYMSVRCTSNCKAGILLRMEKNASGWRGLLVSLSPDDQGSYDVTLDTSGKELSRKKLEPSKSEGGLASPTGNISARQIALRSAPGGNRPIPLPEGINLPDLQHSPSDTYRQGEWNAVNVVAYQDMLDPTWGAGGFTRAGGLVKVSDPDLQDSYGPIALYAGGSGEVQFKDVQWQDLNVLKEPKEYLSPKFTEKHLSGFYFSWTTAIADINHDGIPDVIAGPYYFLGPEFTEAHEFYTPHPYNSGADYAQESMVNLASDFNGDGWPDILVMSGSAGQGIATLYINPRGASKHWESSVVIDPVGNEDTLLADIDGDGKPEVIHSGHDTLEYSKPDPGNPTGKWITTAISEKGPWGAAIGHGLGIADINGDGRMDFINTYGWWEQPPPSSGQKLWTYHPQEFARWGHTQGGAGGAELGVYDVNGDGLKDVVTSLEGHGFGLAWFEQKRDAAGAISFVEHIIMDNFMSKNAGDVIFTEPHATAFADMNGDGIPDLITGKRAMSHLFGYGDPDPLGPAVLYVYTVVHDRSAPGGARFQPTLIHNFSGVGSHFAVKDLNGDGIPDIATSGIYGTFVFFNHMDQVRKISK